MVTRIDNSALSVADSRGSLLCLHGAQFFPLPSSSFHFLGLRRTDG